MKSANRLHALIISFVVAAPLVAPGAAAAQSDRDPLRIFRFAAEVESPGPGLVRLPLPAEVLEPTRPDLSDLRLFDVDEREVPFLVDGGRRPWPSDAPPSLALSPIAVRERGRRFLDPNSHQVFRFAAPPEPAEGGHWELSIDTPAPRFVREIVVHWETDDDVTELARASVFRLPAPLRERRHVALPPLPPPTADARLVVSIHGEGPLLSPTVRLDGRRAAPGHEGIALPLETAIIERGEGYTLIEVVRPPGLVPERLEIGADDLNFHREVVVLDVRQGRDGRELGRATLYRIAELEGAEQLEVRLGRASGERLRLRIEDADAPSLEGLRVTARIAQPSLIFEGSRARLLLFGGARARERRHDLARLAGTSLGERILESNLPEASLSPAHENPRYDSAPALAFAMRAGRDVDSASFSHRATLEVSEAREGLSRFEPSPALIASARDDLGDLRVVDGEGRQWPYVRSPAEVILEVEASVGAPETTARRSRYPIALPVGPLPIRSLALELPEAYVARGYVLWGIDAHDERQRLTSGSLSRSPGERGPLKIEFARARIASLELEVEDGDDAPLELEHARLDVVTHAIFLAAPAGDYRVLVGDEAQERPSYELERALDLVLAVVAEPASLGEVEGNPAHQPAPFWQTIDAAGVAVWAVLVLAVLLLGLLTLKVVRSAEPEEPGPREGEPPTEASTGEGVQVERLDPEDEEQG